MNKRVEKGMWWDRAWSLVEGCAPVTSGCKNCWAAAQTHMRARQKNGKIRDRYEGLTFSHGQFKGQIRIMWDELKKPLNVKKLTRWAVWNDLFHADVPTDFIDRAVDVMDACWYHRFIILTKRPKLITEKLYGNTREHPCRELGGGDYLPNVMLMTSVEDQATADKRIPELLKVPGDWMRGVSYEPALGPVNFSEWLPYACGCRSVGECYHNMGSQLDYLISGGESGPGARPSHPDWFRSARDQCVGARVPFFFKQWGEWSLDGPHDYDKIGVIAPDGWWSKGEPLGYGRDHKGCVSMWRVGKRHAGRLLDGRTWDELPEGLTI